MSVFSHPDFRNHEQVVFIADADTGLRAVIAVHNTTLGPALGGCRMYPYASDDDAIRDVLRLSHGMTYKAAMAGVHLGGGKSIIIGDPRSAKTEALLRSMGRAIRELGGRYIAGEDMGTDPADMRVLRRETVSVSCLDVQDGGYGDPSPMTALGVVQAIRAALVEQRGSPSTAGVTVAIQGVGNVGLNLCRLLTEAGAKLVVCDSYAPSAQRAADVYNALVVGPEEIYSSAADIFAPCAVGGTLNPGTIPRLKATIVAGAANNQLADEDCARRLYERGILYVPDFVANGGGLIACAAEWYKTGSQKIEADVRKLYETCLSVLQTAAAENTYPVVVANRIVEQRLHRYGQRRAVTL